MYYISEPVISEVFAKKKKKVRHKLYQSYGASFNWTSVNYLQVV